MAAEFFVKLCFDGDLEAVRAALQFGVDVNSKDKYGQTGLMKALFGKRTAVARLLLNQRGINVNIIDNCGNTALHFAAAKADWGDRNKKSLAMLFARTTSVNQRNGIGQTPLHWAVNYNAVSCIRLLLSDKRTDPNIKDDRGDSPYTYPIKIKSWDSTPLMAAVKRNRVDCVKLLLADPRVDLMTRDVRSERVVAR